MPQPTRYNDMTETEKEAKRKQHVLRKERKSAKRAAKEVAEENTTTTTTSSQATSQNSKKRKKAKKEKKEKKDKKKKDKSDKKKSKSKKDKKDRTDVKKEDAVPAISSSIVAEEGTAVETATATTATEETSSKKRKSKSKDKKNKKKRARTDSNASSSSTTTTTSEFVPSTSKFTDGYTDQYLMELKKTDPSKLKEIRKARQKAKRAVHSKTKALENIAMHKQIQEKASKQKESKMQKWEIAQITKKKEEEIFWKGKPTKVFIGGLPFGVSEKRLQKFFQSCGSFEHLDMPVFEDSGRSMGVAHIDFSTAKGAAHCVEMNEVTWCGRWLKIVFHDQMSREDGRYEQMKYGFGDGAKEERREKVRPEQNPTPGPCPKGCTRLWIGGLPYDATKEQITGALSMCGEVVSVQISTDKETDESKGFGHVVFLNEIGCETAMMTAASNKGVLVGTQLCRVDYATQRSWEKPRDSSTSNKSDQYGERANATSTESGGGVEGAANGVHWKHDNKTRGRNRGAVEDFKGAKVKFEGSDDSSSDSDSD